MSTTKEKFFSFNRMIFAIDRMGMGVLATLIVGTILRQIATLFGESADWLFTIGSFAQVLMAAAVAIGAALALEAKPVVFYGTLVTTAMGAGAIRITDSGITLAVGDPAAAFATAIFTVWIGYLVVGRTKVDVLVTPMICMIFGGVFAMFVAPHVTALTSWIGVFITTATYMHPVWMGMIVAIVFCFIILSPLSSSALAIGLGLSGTAAGAALAGTAASMVGFAAISFKDNGWGGFISQGIGTSKIQFGNFVKNPAIFLPTMVAAAITGLVSTMIFHIETNSLGAGMGTSGFVGQLQTVYVMGIDALPTIVFVQVAIPLVISLIVYNVLIKISWIKSGDMILPKS